MKLFLLAILCAACTGLKASNNEQSMPVAGLLIPRDTPTSLGSFIPTEASKVRINFCTEFGRSTYNGCFYAWVYKNGAEIKIINKLCFDSAIPTDPGFCGSGNVHAAAGEVIEVRIGHSQHWDLNLTGTENRNYIEFDAD